MSGSGFGNEQFPSPEPFFLSESPFEKSIE